MWKLCETLKQLGFYLFDDIIDLAYDNERDTTKRLSMVMEEIKKLGEYSIEELHNLYWDREEKLRHNHQLMQELARNQVETIRDLIEPHKKKNNMIINKVYHLADLHIRNLQRHKEYKIIFKKFLKQVKEDKIEDSIIYIAGDIAHAKTEMSPELVQEISWFLTE